MHVILCGAVLGIGGVFAVLITGPGGMGAEHVSTGRMVSAFTVYAVGFFGPLAAYLIFTREK